MTIEKQTDMTTFVEKCGKEENSIYYSASHFIDIYHIELAKVGHENNAIMESIYNISRINTEKYGTNYYGTKNTEKIFWSDRYQDNIFKIRCIDSYILYLLNLFTKECDSIIEMKYMPFRGYHKSLITLDSYSKNKHAYLKFEYFDAYLDILKIINIKPGDIIYGNRPIRVVEA